MASTTCSPFSTLVQKTLLRQTKLAQSKFRLEKNQVQETLLKKVNNNDNGPFFELIKILKEYPIIDENFKILFEDCLQNVVLLGKELHTFVAAVFGVEWLSRNDILVELHSKYVLSLVTAHNYHCTLVFRQLLNLFKDSKCDSWEENPPEELLNKWSKVHSIIAQILAVVPMAADVLLKEIISQFPYYKAGCKPNRTYVYNLIWTTKYVPTLRDQIMLTIINKMTIMDVNIDHLNNLDTNNRSALNITQHNTLSETIMETDVSVADELSDTLDYCMLDILKYIEDERDPLVLNTMCNIFEKVVLPTHGTKFIQFLILYTISINQQTADRILSNLWAVVSGLHGLGALATRKTATSHLAGLLARCVRIPNSRLIKYLKCMADWCHKYITATQESMTASSNIKVHGTFHSMCHAIFYLVAFKHHYLLSTKDNLNFIESLNLPRLVTCSLNPLKTCPTQIVRAFSSVTRAHQVAYCEAIVEKNSRLTLNNAPEEKFDDWFPYDPYSLQRSGIKIWPLCIEYKDFGNDKENDQFTSRKRKLDDDDYLMLNNNCLRSRTISSSLSNYISPGFKTSETVM